MTGRSGATLFDLAKQLQPVHARHVDLGPDRSPAWLNLPRKPVQSLRARCGEVHYIGTLPDFTTIAQELRRVITVVTLDNHRIMMITLKSGRMITIGTKPDPMVIRNVVVSTRLDVTDRLSGTLAL